MAKKSAQGSGSIRQRKDGLWEARYTIGRDPATGKQIRKSVYGKTQQEVRKKMTAANADIDKGIYTEPSKITFSQWLEIWLSEYCGAVKPRTLTLYQNTVKIRVKPFLGQIQLCRLTPVIFQKYYNDSIKGNLKGLDAISAKTVKNVHGIIHKALQKAVELGYLKSNPVSACVLPKAQRKELHPLNEAQTKAFMKALEREPFRRLFLVALFTGIREGELLGLTWDDVDFQKREIHVNKTLVYIKDLETKRYVFKYQTPKTKNSMRTIPMQESVYKALKRQCIQKKEMQMLSDKWEPLNGFENLVFVGQNGKPITEHSFQVTLDGIEKAINKERKKRAEKNKTEFIPIQHFYPHALRHTFATRCFEAGIEAKVVQGFLGHYSIAITLDLYTHVTNDKAKTEMDKLENLYQEII